MHHRCITVMHILPHGTWLVKQMWPRGGVGFSERMADSHGLWFGANRALETRAGSCIAIDRPSGFSGSWVADTFLFSRLVGLVWSVLFFLFVWFVLFIWLNKTNQMNQRDEIDQRDEMNQIDQCLRS